MGKKTIVILIMFSLIGLNFSYAQETLHVPETLEEAGEMGKGTGRKIIELLPNILEDLWENRVLSVWRKMWDFAKNIWENYIFAYLQRIWEKIAAFLKKEIKKRIPIIKEEFEKEKEELKEEAPELGKSLWERFRELIK